MQTFEGSWVDVTQERKMRVRNGMRVTVQEDGQIIHMDTILEGRADVQFGSTFILPGFIDAHIHFPQTFATHFPAAPLLHWLEKNVFPQEGKLCRKDYARRIAKRFCEELIRAGTTCAAIYGSQFMDANLVLAQEMKRLGLTALFGPTIMDIGPTELVAPLSIWQDQMECLLDLWREEPKLHLSVIPRFVLSCSDELLAWCGQFANEHDLTIQTHINENGLEIDAVSARFPNQTYSQVYDQFRLLDNVILAHNIHPKADELELLASKDARVAHCASSNLFLGSGLFSMKKHREAGIPFCLGTDIGAGTSFRMNAELMDVYKVQSLQNKATQAEELLYLSTLAGAEVLGLEKERGNFEVGKKADFTVWQVEGWLSERLDEASSIEEKIFILLTCGERPSHVFIDGKSVKE